MRFFSMHEFASYNHEILPVKDIKLNAISNATLYGKGIFTTIAIFNEQPFLWEKHWNRLIDNAEKIGIDLSDFSEIDVKNSLDKIIKKNSIANGRCRLTFFDESSSQIWQTSNTDKTSLLIQTAGFREVKGNLKLTVSPFPINSQSPLVNVKSCNYLENLIALENAKEQGFDEAIRLNEKGKVVSACMANIFWLKGEKVFTPSLKTGCLNGTTRELILKNEAVFEVEESLETLENVDAIFLTSAGIGITQVGRFQEKEFARELHELTRIIEAKKN